MTITIINLSKVQIAEAIINDNQSLAKALERTSTSMWTLIENDEVGFYNPNELLDLSDYINGELFRRDLEEDDYKLEF